MREFSGVPHGDLTLMDLYEECDRRIGCLDSAQFKNEDQYEAAEEIVIKELLSEIKDIWE